MVAAAEVDLAVGGWAVDWEAAAMAVAKVEEERVAAKVVVRVAGLEAVG